jgi:hypothetical protein
VLSEIKSHYFLQNTNYDQLQGILNDYLLFTSEDIDPLTKSDKYSFPKHIIFGRQAAYVYQQIAKLYQVKLVNQQSEKSEKKSDVQNQKRMEPNRHTTRIDEFKREFKLTMMNKQSNAVNICKDEIEQPQKYINDLEEQICIVDDQKSELMQEMNCQNKTAETKVRGLEELLLNQENQIDEYKKQEKLTQAKISVMENANEDQNVQIQKFKQEISTANSKLKSVTQQLSQSKRELQTKIGEFEKQTNV